MSTRDGEPCYVVKDGRGCPKPLHFPQKTSEPADSLENSASYRVNFYEDSMYFYHKS